MKRDKIVWLWLLPTVAAASYVESGILFGQKLAIPFLLLYTAAFLAAGAAGRRVGLVAGLIGTAIIIHSAIVSFGPASLTGNGLQVAAGSALLMLTVYWLGRLRDDNNRFLHELTSRHSALQSEHALTQAELADSQAMLRQAQRLESLGLLAGGIAHDLNNVLTGIMGNTTMAQMRATDGQVVEALKAIDRGATQAGELSRRMLTISGKERGRREEVELYSLVEEVLGLVRPSFLHNVEYQVEASAEAEANLFLMADRSQLHQLLQNLITNASEAIAETGKVRISIQYLDSIPKDVTNYLGFEKLGSAPLAQIEVCDSGEGMDTERLEHVFEPFFTTKASGRGLGLSVVFGIIKSHNGAIRFESEPGRGTTVSVRLPIGVLSGAEQPFGLGSSPKSA